MKSILITPPTPQDHEFLSTLLRKLGFEFLIPGEDELEDSVLLKNMLRERKGDYVSDDEINETLSTTEPQRHL